MDLNDFNLTEASEQGADMQLEHPVTGEPLEHDGKPMVIHLAGVDSVAYRKKQRALQNKRLQLMARSRKPDFDDIDSDGVELLAACTLGWSGLVMGGKELKFTRAEAVDLYEKQVWIREQVDAFVGDRANFFTQRSKRQSDM